MPPLSKTTHTYATHVIPLKCDVYSADDFPADGPVFLFFHAGGLVGWSRIVIPPWLVQTCVKNKWPLVCPSYRLLPQAQGKELLEDAKAAYEFARSLGGAAPRPVIVSGSSAGCFFATLVAYYCEPKPLALLSTSGIPTFRHPFFNSSTLLTPEPLTELDVEKYIAEPVSVGSSAENGAFYAESLLPSGAKNPDFRRPEHPPKEHTQGTPHRGLLYDYYLYENMFVPLVGDADPGFDWTKEQTGRDKLSSWPQSIFIAGDTDPDVDPDLSISTAKALGSKASLFIAKGQGHLFEMENFIEDEGLAMDTVRQAVQSLEKAVESSLAHRA